MLNIRFINGIGRIEIMMDALMCALETKKKNSKRKKSMEILDDECGHSSIFCKFFQLFHLFLYFFLNKFIEKKTKENKQWNMKATYFFK